MPSQQVLQQKTSEVEEIVDVLKDCKSIGIASLQKVRASQLQELKKSISYFQSFKKHSSKTCL